MNDIRWIPCADVPAFTYGDIVLVRTTLEPWCPHLRSLVLSQLHVVVRCCKDGEEELLLLLLKLLNVCLQACEFGAIGQFRYRSDETITIQLPNETMATVPNGMIESCLLQNGDQEHLHDAG